MDPVQPPLEIEPPDHDQAGLEVLLDYLKVSRAFDFTGYKRASLARRVQHRLQILGIERYADYVDHLSVHPDEFAQLFNTILINVTGFFRDPATWQVVGSEVLPALLEAKGPDGPIRVWSAGCATGEEAYTLAMLLAEAIGPEEARRRVKIYATDIDEDDLTVARQGSFRARDVEAVPPKLREKYFEPVGERWTFRKDVRRCVIFGRHDLLHDAPILRIDLLTCRNTLMYFNTEAQRRILARLHFAMADGGHLVLGKAEMLLNHPNLFKAVDLKRRVFTRTGSADLRDGLLGLSQGTDVSVGRAAQGVRMRDAAFDSDATAQIVLDNEGHLAMANERARLMFGVPARGVGRPIDECEIGQRPVELRALLEAVRREKVAVTRTEVPWITAPGTVVYLEVTAAPLLSPSGEVIGARVTYVDETRMRMLNHELNSSQQALDTAYVELQSSSEELETTNEELQSTVEELETTNEELQSSNEELETMNEELQSTNEELQHVNDDLRDSGSRLNDVNSFLESILTSLEAAVVVLDRDLKVTVWSRRAEQMWGLRSDEVVSKTLDELEFGLPMDPIRPTLLRFLDEIHDALVVTVDARNRAGRDIRCRLTISSLLRPDRTRAGVVVLMQEEAQR